MKHISIIVIGIATVYLSGCESLESKYDQRMKWKKFREESPNTPMTPFKKWPAEN